MAGSEALGEKMEGTDDLQGPGVIFNGGSSLNSSHEVKSLTLQLGACQSGY